MKYVNADVILPEVLLKEIQKYIHGGMLYIRSLKACGRNGARIRAAECI